MIWMLLLIAMPLMILFFVGYIAALLDLDDLCPRKPAADYRVLILGYHPRLAGGVTSVTRTLLERMPEARLLPIKHCYGAWDWVLYAGSLVRLTVAFVMTRRPLVSHLIVASRGDRVRGVLPILLCRLFRVPICAHYHTNRANMSLGNIPAVAP
jgi:hypothetical protein